MPPTGRGRDGQGSHDSRLGNKTAIKRRRREGSWKGIHLRMALDWWPSVHEQTSPRLLLRPPRAEPLLPAAAAPPAGGTISTATYPTGQDCLLSSDTLFGVVYSLFVVTPSVNCRSSRAGYFCLQSCHDVANHNGSPGG